MAVQQYGENTFYLEGGEALVTIREATKSSEDIGDALSVSVQNKSVKIKQWGVQNDQPNVREQLIKENNIVPQLIATKRNIIIGGEFVAYKSRWENGEEIKDYMPIPTQEQDFLEEMDFEKYQMDAMNNLLMHSNLFVEYIRDKGGRVISMQVKQCRHVRAEVMDMKGMINNYVWRGNWTKKGKGKKDTDFPPVTIPAFDKTKQQAKFMLHIKDDMLTDEYYGVPLWWGGKSWIETANVIPDFHKANLQHGYTIRYHIEIPKDYFAGATSAKQLPDAQNDAENRESKAKQEFIDKLNDFLAGVNRAGRALVTTYEINKALGKDFPGIKVTPLSVDLQDKALLDLFEKSNQANISAQGVHPTLAAIETSGKLSSGSEIRNAFLMYTAIHAPVPRMLLLKPWNLVRKLNGWDPTIKYTFKDIEIKTLDEEKSGTADVAIQ